MKTIDATTVQVKLSDGHEDQHVLVHDGKTVLELAAPGIRVGTHPRNTMLVGTREELETEIARLGLAARRPRPGRVERPR